ncbi:MAG: S8 family serine peptidase [Thermoleophilia bacterium]|nr:S8 family serine peptidase [Thermoleophilia bacterium]
MPIPLALLAGLVLACGGARAATVDPALARAVAGGGEAPALAVLRRQAAVDDLAGRRADGPEVVRRLRAAAATSQPGLVRRLAGRVGGLRRLWAANALAARVDAAGLAALAADPAVARVVLDRPHPLLDAAPLGGWAGAPGSDALARVGIPAAWSAGLHGEGRRIGLIDSGVSPHSVFDTRIGGWFDVAGAPTPDDVSGHGTMTASLAGGGVGPLSGRQLGAAPEATLLVARALRPGSSSFTGADLVLAGQWMLDPDGDPQTADQPDVVSNSWGGVGAPDQDPAFHAVVRTWLAAGIVPVFAAGNSGCQSGTAPTIAPDGTCVYGRLGSVTLTRTAGFPDALAVGAVLPDGAVAGFSSRGPATWLRTDRQGPPAGAYPKPDLAAPGWAVPAMYWWSGTGAGETAAASGTSAAAPIVAGAAALLRQARPSLTAGQVMQVLRESAADAGAPGPDPDFGHGMLDLDAALDHAADTTPPVVGLAAPPAWTREASVRLVGRADDDRRLDEATLTRGALVEDLIGGGDGAFDLTLALAPGPNPATIRARDLAGNVIERDVSVGRDVAEPHVEALAPALVTDPAGAEVRVRASDPGESGIAEVTAGGRPVALGADGTGTALVAVPHGASTIGVQAADRVGRVATAQVAVVRDLAAPVLRVEAPAVVRPGPVVIGVEATDADGDPVDVTADGRAVAPGPVVVDAPEEGARVVRLRGADPFGRRSPEHVVTVTVDGTPPSISVERADPSGVTGRVDDPHLAAVWADGERLAPAGGAFRVPLDVAPGTRREVRLAATDLAGNRAERTVLVEGPPAAAGPARAVLIWIRMPARAPARTPLVRVAGRRVPVLRVGRRLRLRLPAPPAAGAVAVLRWGPRPGQTARVRLGR